MALAALILAIIGTAISLAALVRGELTRRAIARAELVSDLAELLEPIHEQLATMVTTAPPSLPAFLTIFGQAMVRLEELLPAIRDRPLRARITAVTHCLEAMQAALPSTIARGADGELEPTEEQATRLATAREIAHDGAAHAATALRRIDKLRIVAG